ncbi:MAG: O-antigen ligase family protein [Gammaproteobacteria bacterium]|jgi:O-antigen ligase|nr:O-antigen ligase family protein [Gammaproteobacteria bacterium]
MERAVVITRSPLNLGLLWLLTAISSIVFFEPTPYDILGFTLLLLFFGLGLRLPTGLGTPVSLLGVYIITNAFASALAPDPVASLRPLIIHFYLLGNWIFFICLIYENPARVLKVLYSGYLFAAIIAVTLGILGYYKLVPYTEQLIEYGRVRSLFKDPNVYGPFLVPVALYLVARLESATHGEKFVFIGIFAFLTFGILLSFSRGSWLNMAIALVLYAILRPLIQPSARVRRRLMLQTGVVAVFLALFLGWVINTDHIQSMVERRAKLQYYDVQAEGGRFSRQLAVIKMALVRPLGIGEGQSRLRHNFGKEPHNIFLQVLIESGWIGALAFYSFLVLTLVKAFKFLFQPSTIQAVYLASFVCVIGLLVQSLFIDSAHWRHLYLLLAALWGPMLAWKTDVMNHWWANEAAANMPTDDEA